MIYMIVIKKSQTEYCVTGCTNSYRYAHHDSVIFEGVFSFILLLNRRRLILYGENREIETTEVVYH